MPKQLWARLPAEMRFVRGWTPRAWLDRPYAPRCPYAIRDATRRGFYQCGRVVTRDQTTCAAHREDRPLNDAIQQKRAEAALCRSARYVMHLRTAEGGGAWVRALTDDDILELGGVGPVVAGHIRTIRDTWTDEQIAKILRLPPAGVATSTPRDPADFWLARHDVFSLVGG